MSGGAAECELRLLKSISEKPSVRLDRGLFVAPSENLNLVETTSL